MSREDDLIARHFAPLVGPGGLGLADDAALLSVPDGHELVLTKDMLVEGIHFFGIDPPESIARKALRVNLSDLAAKGATPCGFLLGLGLTKRLMQNADALEQWLAGFAEALGADAAFYECPLLGGDTVSSPERLTLSISAFGLVPRGQMLRRTGAKTGDAIYVTGTIGDAALGLQLRLRPDAPWATGMSASDKVFLLDRYLHPQPRNVLARAIGRHAHAGMDVSDGLVGDLAKMMRVSRVGANVNLDGVPLSGAARAALMADPSLAEMVFTGGDDYELLCTVPQGAEVALREAARAVSVQFTCIGRVSEGESQMQFFKAGRPVVFSQGAYSHL